MTISLSVKMFKWYIQPLISSTSERLLFYVDLYLCFAVAVWK